MHNSGLAFDPSCPDIDHSNFWDCDLKDFYESAMEAIPCNIPPPRGKEVNLQIFRDSNYAGDKQTRRSRTGFMIYVNMSLISWYFKKQSTIKTSVFGKDFVAMKVKVETLQYIQY